MTAMLLRLAAKRQHLAWLLILILSVAIGLFSGLFTRSQQQNERVRQLQISAERLAVQVISSTLNSDFMGALGVLGVVDQEFKVEVSGRLKGDQPGEQLVTAGDKTIALSEKNLATLESVGRSFNLAGVFLCRADGYIGSAWYASGKPSFGNYIKFRPYFKSAINGKGSVYAAIGTKTGERVIYVSAPVQADTSRTPIGVVVARVGMQGIDELLARHKGIALLLSPQQLVFAANNKGLLNHIAVEPRPDLIKAIRQEKQFAGMFDEQIPQRLPFTITNSIQKINGRNQAVATADIDWHDPLGKWTLVLTEDFASSIPFSGLLVNGMLGGVLAFLLGGMLLRVVVSQHNQLEAGKKVKAIATEQEKIAERKSKVAMFAMQLQQEQTVDALAHTFLKHSHELLGVLQGTIYVAEYGGNVPVLQLVGCYACAEAPPTMLAAGEGLIGQTVMDQTLRIIEMPQESEWKILSGLGSTKPGALVIAPVVLHDTCAGVVELALQHMPDNEVRSLLDELFHLLAMNFAVVQRSEYMNEMLSSVANAELSKAEQLNFQQTLLDTIPNPLFYCGSDSRFLGVNREFEKTFNLHRDELIGKRILDMHFFTEEDRITCQQESEQIIAHISKLRRVAFITFADGKVHKVLYFASGFGGADEQPGGMVGTFIDLEPFAGDISMKSGENQL